MPGRRSSARWANRSAPAPPTDDTLARWFRQADRNRDGMLTVDEMQADADRFFATLDADHNGEIEPEELIHYEWEIAPDIQVMSKRRPAPAEAKANPAKSGADERCRPGGRPQASPRAGRRASGRGALCAPQHPRAGGGRRHQLRPRDFTGRVQAGGDLPVPASRPQGEKEGSRLWTSKRFGRRC